MPPKGQSVRRHPARRRVQRGDDRRGVDTNYQRAGPMANPTYGFPDRMIVDLPYGDHRQVTSATAYSEYIYNANSGFDPDRTGTGHQPRYWDRYAAIYNRYRVLKVRVTAEMRNRAQHGAAAIVVADNSSAALISESYPSELPHAKYCGITSSNQPPVHCDYTVLPWAVTGRTKQEYMADDIYGAPTAASPSEIICLHFLTQSLDNSTAADVEWHVRLIYTIEFYDRFTEGVSIVRNPRSAVLPAADGAAAAAAALISPRPSLAGDTRDADGSGDEVIVVRRRAPAGAR